MFRMEARSPEKFFCLQLFDDSICFIRSNSLSAWPLSSLTGGAFLLLGACSSRFSNCSSLQSSSRLSPYELLFRLVSTLISDDKEFTSMLSELSNTIWLLLKLDGVLDLNDLSLGSRSKSFDLALRSSRRLGMRFALSPKNLSGSPGESSLLPFWIFCIKDWSSLTAFANARGSGLFSAARSRETMAPRSSWS